MEVHHKDRASSLEGYGIIYGIIIILILLAARFIPPSYIPALCPFKGITGLPCPTCGGSRALSKLAHLDPLGAFDMNPLISSFTTIGIILFSYSTVAFILRPLRIGVRFNQIEKRLLRLACLGIIILNWFYLIISGI